VHSQICNGVPFAIAPFVTSRHMLPNTCNVEPETVQLCLVSPPMLQSSILTVAPFASDEAARHLSKLSVTWIYWFDAGT
jgi:hypothetical protein